MTATRPTSSGTWIAATLLAALALVLTGAPTTSASTSGEPVRVIVSGVAGAGAEVAEAVTDVGGDVLRRLQVVQGVVAEVPAERQDELATASGVRSVTPDATVTVSSGAYEDFDPSDWTGSLPTVADTIGAQDLWSRGIHGQGVDVAMVDTGVSEVPGLDDGQVLHGPDLSFDSQDPATRHVDTYGHGTHLAGIIAGREAGAPLPSGAGDDDHLTGIAPGSRLVSVKIGNRDGAADVSQAIAAIDWVVQHRNTDGLDIRVLNLAFGFDSEQGYEVDPLAYAAEVAWRKGIVVVAAAGNGGQNAGLASPAYSPHVLAVGATDHMGTRTTADDQVPSWSSCDPQRNPDVLAPGRSLVSARVPVSYVAHHYPESRVTDTLALGSGTSQATAVTSGAAALLLSQRPDATPDEIRALLTSTANPVKTNAPKPCQGDGVIDLAEAATTATPSVSSNSAAFSSGLGSLEDARGSVHVVDATLPEDDYAAGLTGEQDIFGMPWEPQHWTEESLAGSSWTDGWWNGSAWTGSAWTGSAWTGSAWTGSAWTGSAWTGSAWTGSAWTGSAWTGSAWTGSAWTDAAWTGSAWTGSAWTSVDLYGSTRD